MFNFLVSGAGWDDGRDTIPVSRTLEHTGDELIARFRVDGRLDLAALVSFPALFMAEGVDGPDLVAKVGTITRARISGRDVVLEFAYDLTVPSLSTKQVKALQSELDIDDFEFSRTHWAVKDVDLFRVLLRNLQPRRNRARVFQLCDPERIEPQLVSAMMPFHPDFNAVYATLKDTAEAVRLRCRRADDIWESPAVIQDVVSLIDRSNVVIADCSGRNPNVFYEVGIAHALGREVILITQAESDIPFDLRHLRYVKYLNNGEGLMRLRERLQPRLADLGMAV